MNICNTLNISNRFPSCVLVSVAVLFLLQGSPAGQAAPTTGESTAKAAAAAPLEPVTVDESLRPRPADLNFAAAAKEVRVYLAGLPEKAMKRENSRIRMMGELRDEWLKSKIAYDGEKKGIQLNNGMSLRGSPMFNDRQILILRRGGKPIRLKPMDIATAQYLLFLEDHVQQKISRSSAGGGKAAAEAVSRAMGREAAAINQLVGNDCFRLAILFDWYEKPVQARKYAAEAIRFHAGLAPAVHAYFPTPEP